MRKLLSTFVALAAGLAGAESHLRYSDEQKRWALATSAIPVEMGSGNHELLSMFEGSEANEEAQLRALRRRYQIRTGKQLRETIRNLKESGNRSDFVKLAGLTRESVAVWRDMHPAGTQRRQQVEDAVEYGPRFGQRSITGWDFAEIGYLCRAAYLAAMMSEDEAWTCVIDAAAVIQKSFRSWQEFGTNYMIGRRFWDATGPDTARVDWIFRNLLIKADSPWRKLPWNLELTPGAQAVAESAPPVETSAHLQLASHPGGLTCFQIRVCDRAGMPSLLAAFAEAFGCRLQAVSETRESRDYNLRGDCPSPFASSGRSSSTALSFDRVYAELRKAGVSQVFLTWDHPRAASSEMTPFAHYRWETANRAFEERSFYLDVSTPQVRLNYGSPESPGPFVAPWAWLGLLIAIWASMLAGYRRPSAERLPAASALVQAQQNQLLPAIWAVWTMGVVVSRSLPALAHSLNLSAGAQLVALLLLCVPPIVTYAICMVMLGDFQRHAGVSVTRLSDLKLGLATAALRGVWPAVAMVWFTRQDLLPTGEMLFTIFLVHPIRMFFVSVVWRCSEMSAAKPISGPLLERAREMALGAKVSFKGIRSARVTRPGWLLALPWLDRYVYVPEMAFRIFSKTEMDAFVAEPLLLLRGSRWRPLVGTVNTGVFLAIFAGMRKYDIPPSLNLAIAGAMMWTWQNVLLWTQQFSLDGQTAKLVNDPSATVRAIRKRAEMNGLPQDWSFPLAVGLGEPSPAARARVIAGLLPVAEEEERVMYDHSA